MRIALGLLLAGTLTATPAYSQVLPAAPSVGLPASSSVAPATTLLGLRVETAPEGVTLKLELTGGVLVKDESDASACRLRLVGLSPYQLPLFSQPTTDKILPELRWEQDGADPILVMPWKYRLPLHVIPEGTTRLTVLLDKVFTEASDRTVAPGLRYRFMRRGTPDGPLSIHVLAVNPKAPGIRIAPALAENKGRFGLEPVSRIAQRQGAIAAVNGAYFGRGGMPLGLLMIRGELLTGPIYARTALVLGAAGPVIERSATAAMLELPGGQSVEVDGVNQPRWDEQIVLYTERYGERTRTEAKGRSFEAAVQNGRVIAVGSADLPIPPGGFVVSAMGGSADWLERALPVGTAVAMKSTLPDVYEGVEHVIAGGPRLLEGGSPKLTTEAERFQADVAKGRAPRTAVGITPSGELLVVAVDGRDPKASMGLTLPELASLMQELGAKDALNLDGGGSTTFYLEGKTLNHPSDGVERSVSNALCIWSDAVQAGP
ncbi:MAG TPA: phosphodiester glycosidase family protein [Stenomitos sp.]